MLDADLLKPVADEIAQKADVMLIGYAGGGTRNIFANKPVHNLAEMKGLKVRVQGAPIWSKTFAAVGMSPTVIAYNEIYNAIQNSVINGRRERGGRRRGDEVLRGRARTSRMTEHAITIRPICFSGKTFKRLPPDLQAAIVKAGKEAGAYGRQVESGEDTAKLDALEKAGKLKRIAVHRPRRDEEARRSGDGRLRQGNRRRRRSSRKINAHQVAEPRSPTPAIAPRPACRARCRDGTAHACKLHRRLSPAADVAAGRRASRMLIIPVTLQIISRYTALIPAYIWTEELSRFLFIWMVMLGAMIGVRERTHFEVDVWPDAEAARQCAAAHRLATSSCWSSRWCSSGGASSSCSFGWNQTSELADLPMGFIFVAWPLAGVTWLLFLGERFVRQPAHRSRARRTAPMTGGGAAVARRWRRWSCSASSSRCMVLRVPVAFALGLACLPLLLIEPRLSPMVLFNETFKAYNSFILLAVPFFLLTANLMSVGGITDRLVRLSRAMVGNFPGALAQINVVLSVFFAGISGSSTADAASQGKIFIDAQTRRATTCRSRSPSRRCRRCWR